MHHAHAVYACVMRTQQAHAVCVRLCAAFSIAHMRYLNAGAYVLRVTMHTLRAYARVVRTVRACIIRMQYVHALCAHKMHNAVRMP